MDKKEILLKVAWVHDTPFSVKCFKKTANRGAVVNKPNGGLWTSPIGCENSWERWCNDEFPGRLGCMKHIITVDISNVFIIDSFDVCENLPTYTDCHGFEGIDFEKMAEIYSGVWVKPFPNWRFHRPYDFNSWDVETVWICDKNVIKNVEKEMTIDA